MRPGVCQRQRLWTGADLRNLETNASLSHKDSQRTCFGSRGRCRNKSGLQKKGRGNAADRKLSPNQLKLRVQSTRVNGTTTLSRNIIRAVRSQRGEAASVSTTMPP